MLDFLRRRSVEAVDRETLETWDTKKLLRRLDVLRRCMDWIDPQDISPEEAAEVAGRILHKDTPGWERAYREVKEILDSREHVPRKAELKYSSNKRGRSQKSGQNRRGRR